MSSSDQIPLMKKDASCHSAKMIAVDKKGRPEYMQNLETLAAQGFAKRGVQIVSLGHVKSYILVH